MRIYVKINAVIEMKMKKNYMIALTVFLVAIMVTLVIQFKHFKFQFYHINSYHGFDYSAQSDNFTMTDYFGSVSAYYGGATVEMVGAKPNMKAFVFLEDGTELVHQMTKISDQTYLLDVQNLENVRQKPVSIEIREENQQVLARSDILAVVGQLYQASSYEYSFLNIFINQAGVFMGQFEAFNAQQVLNHYDTITVEFCHQDASKSSGYQLLARTKMDVKSFLELDDLGFIPFLPTAHYDSKKEVEVILTFEGSENRQAIIMTLEKGAN